MMKFFALVALAMFATANATVATDLVLTRGTTLLGGVAGGDLIITFTTAAEHTTGKTITVTPDSNLFTTDTDVTCTATPNTITGIAGASVGAVLTLTVTGTIAATTEAVITCTSNLANNAAAGTAVAVTMVSETDVDTCTGTGYTTTTGVASFTASRGTTVVTALAPGTLVFGFTPTTQVELDGVITLTSDKALFTASATIACTATYATIAVAVPTFVAATTKADATGKILTLTLKNAATDILPAAKAATITCAADNMAVNTAAGAVKFTVGTTTDKGPTVQETGYTITTGVSAFSATRGTSYLTLEAPGSLVFKFTPTTQVAIGTDAVTLIASAEIFTANNPTDCTMAVASGTAPSSITTTVATKNTLKVTTVGQILLADVAVTVTCLSVTGTLNNMAANTAAGAVTFSIATTGDIGPLAAQTGYTICAATGCPTSAASSTASVGMLTMLALAGVAMRQ